MTNGPPSIAASSSKSHLANGDSQLNPPNSYYPNVHSNISATHMPYYQHYKNVPMNPSSIPPSTKTSAGAKKSQPAQTRSSTPPLPEPETYKHWDEAIKKFLIQTQLAQTLKGFEHDMLVLNPDWEQEVIPKALKEMMAGLQSILDRIAGKKKADGEVMDTNPDVDNLSLGIKPDEKSSLDERKLGYLSLANGTQPRSHSSINKSISQLLAQTRSRNDASNRLEFLYTPAEKRRRLQEAGINPEGVPLPSCARVDAKPIDRDKQMEYDIAKNGEGPLIKTVKQDAQADPSAAATQPLSQATTNGQHNVEGIHALSNTKRPLAKKRKFVDFAENHTDMESGEVSKSKIDLKSKGKKKETYKDPSLLPDVSNSGDEEAPEMRITPQSQSALSERLINIEEHLAIRYVPSIPRTFLARLKYLEDHLINLEKEYPPWAALHFNQPSRGWPAPPRATPIIVPPHLRSSSTPQNSAAPGPLSTLSTTGLPVPSSTASNPAVHNASTIPGVKFRKSNSTLHRAVLDRLEVQQAMSEMNAARDSHQGT